MCNRIVQVSKETKQVENTTTIGYPYKMKHCSIPGSRQIKHLNLKQTVKLKTFGENVKYPYESENRGEPLKVDKR